MKRSGSSRRPLLVVAACLLLLVGVSGYRSWTVEAPVALPPPVVAAVGGPGPVDRVPASAPVVVPTFDVVRVGPRGDAVIAGRAAPGSDVVVFDGDTAVARARADWRGSFVAIPAAPLPAGGRSLLLEARGEQGAGAAVRSGDAVVVVVPEAARGSAEAGTVAVLVPSAAPARVLQAPGVRGVSLDAVDYDGRGEIRFSGAAVPDAVVRVYVDNAPVGDARADGGGRWLLVPGAPVSPGVHTLRLDQLDKAGTVVSRIELPFQRDAAVAVAGAGAGERVVVQPGQSLWRLARTAYGQGTRFTVIFLANREQIRDPARIYPGQAFAIPAGLP